MITDFKNERLRPEINWWSEQTKLNEYTISLEPAEILNSMIVGAFAYQAQQIVGAAGLMHIMTDENEIICFGNKPIVEFRSNCVDPRFQEKGIGKKLMQMRLDYAENEYVSVVITKEAHILHMTQNQHSGWVSMESIEAYSGVLAKIRTCSCHKKKDQPFIGSRCSVCPLYAKSIFVHV
jgi:GNAT superfamily N-acetyltransferase